MFDIVQSPALEPLFLLLKQFPSFAVFGLHSGPMTRCTRVHVVGWLLGIVVLMAVALVKDRHGSV